MSELSEENGVLVSENNTKAYSRIDPLELEDSEQAHRGWLFTYADLITVLLTFFIMLQSLSEFNPDKFNDLFNIEVEVPIEEEVISDPIPVNYKDEILELLRNIQRDIKRQGLRMSVTAETDNNFTMVILRINSNLLFQSGSAQLNNMAYQTIDRIIKVIEPYRNFNINIRGHTDDRPIQTLQFPSNWELSAVRATSVLRHLLEYGIDPMRLTATGYGDLLPVDSNELSTGRAKNRRVEFVLKK